MMEWLERILNRIPMPAFCRKWINRETISYIVVGGVTTVIDIVLLWICSRFYPAPNPVGDAVSKVIAWVGAVAFAFFASKFIVFQSRDKRMGVYLREALSFTASRLFSLGFALVFNWATVQYLGLGINLANLISNVFVVIINYITSKLMVFRNFKQ